MRRLRIVYGVFGYGRGHAGRALAILPTLFERHEVLVVASGAAHRALAPLVTYAGAELVEVPALSYAYDRAGRLSLARTLVRNLSALGDVLLGGRTFASLARRVANFSPDLALCDVEPWTHRVALGLGVPRIAFDHYGILASCRVEVPLRQRLRHRRDVAAYRALTRAPADAIVSSFYPAPPLRPSVRTVGVLLRDAVRAARPRRGEHILVYLNQGDAQLSPSLEETLARAPLPVIVYGTSRVGTHGRLRFEAPSDAGFVDALARAEAVVSTAGNQLVGEAMWLGKPILVMPEDTVEQELNAAAVARLGIGERARFATLSPGRLERFLASAPIYRQAASALARDGRLEALLAIDAIVARLAPRRLGAGPRLTLPPRRLAVGRAAESP